MSAPFFPASETFRRGGLPLGVRDHLGPDARVRRELESRVGTEFRTWGYQDVILPMFEYADTLELPVKSADRARLYRFFDLEGRMLVLRPDMTTSVARVVGTRMLDVEGPHRLCYAGSVFRHDESSGIAYQQEFRQLGIELIGAGTSDADAEVMSCLAAALHACGLSRFSMVVGHSGFFQGLRDSLRLPFDRENRLMDALRRKSEFAVQELLAETRLSGAQRDALGNLLQLGGPHIDDILQKAEGVCLNSRMERALTNLKEVCSGVDAHGEAGHLILDLADVRDLTYYTGVTFDILLPDSTVVAGGGGRYDDLVGNFGPPQAAVGGALQLDRLMRASADSHTSSQADVSAADMFLGCTRDPNGLSFVRRLRREGLTVIVDPLPRTESQLRGMEQSRKSRVTARWMEDQSALRILESEEPEWKDQTIDPGLVAAALLTASWPALRRKGRA